MHSANRRGVICLAPHAEYLESMRSLTVGCALVLSATLVQPGASGAVCVGDFNGDLTVDAEDLGILLANWATSGDGDANDDGYVDGEDLALFFSNWDAICKGSPTEIRLACTPLAVAPFASFVQTFLAGSAITVAVDPALSSAQAGQMADLFVIAARTASEWDANATLVDVRGTAQEITFAAGGVEANRFTLTGGSSLSADGGLAVGRGYDLVIDQDRNGLLSVGDLIDGSDDRAALWVARDPGRAGPHTVTTLASYTASGATAGFTAARLWYPTAIASLSQRPLIVISHGNGHNYTWYDYLGTHLASWGYIVISHQNNTVPGIETASTTTLQHTAAIIAQQASVAGGAINGKIDATRIGWIGHSRGGEGIVRAYDRIFDTPSTAVGYTLSSVKALCSIAPTDFLGVNSANPHSANFMLLYGAADGDVSGVPTNSVAWSFDLAERCAGFRNTVYVHGADHNDFNSGTLNDFVGPAGTEIGAAEAKDVAEPSILVAVKYHLEGEVGLGEFFWRPNTTLRAVDIASTTTVVKELVVPAAAGPIVIDNFQTQTTTTLSSSGGAVTASVANISEALSRDTDATFTWSTSNPHNGSVRATASDTQRMVAWDWNSAQSMEWAVLPALKDMRNHAFVEVRVGQGSRHPNTVTLNGGASFSIVLRDGAGVEVRRSSSLQGEAVNLPYQRTGSGTGAGWQSELRTIRLRLRDFQAGATGIDLSNIVAVRLEVGGTSGSATGRFLLDDLQFTKD